MHTLIFATNNQNKVNEIQALVGDDFNIVPLKAAGIDIDIPEPHDTLQENCFSEDTGLEIESLNGEPGVKSARYAGEGRDFQANIDKVLSKLGDHKNRTAQFRTVICLIWGNEKDGVKTYYFEGICKGHISTEMHGEKGFGYDPVFIPEGANKSFAQMTMDEKNTFSHRQKAVTQLFEFLRSK